MRLGLALCATALLVTAAVASPVGKAIKWVDPATVKDAKPDEAMLPGNVVPERYELAINVYPEKLPNDPKYDGTVTITISPNEDGVKDIFLHAGKGIVVTKAQYMNEDGSSPLDLTQTTDLYDKLKLTAADALVNGTTYKLALEFTGEHRTDMDGFYMSSYDASATDKRWLLTTQFEAAGARSAFPCFDEPQYKAIYSIKITISDDAYKNKGYRVLTNTPAKSDPTVTPHTFEFEDSTVRMSSYLVAMIVSDFKSTAPMDFDSSADATPKNKPFRTWGQARFIDGGQGDLSQNAGTAALEFMTRTLKVEYPYQKVDQVGIPDFSAGAMENWGLVTYRERMIFHDPATGSDSTKQSDVSVTAHELAHQWFGDLVTLHWWSDIWLNEGFATYFQYYASSQMKKNGLDTTKWDMEGQLLTDETRNLAFDTDGNEKVNALYADVYDPNLYMSNFGNIPYAKGGSILRMLHNVLSGEIFYAGLTNYLNDRKGDVGHPDDLFRGLDKAYTDVTTTKPDLKGLTVATFMANWHKNPGYPVVTVKQSTDDPKKYTLTQSRFLWAAPSDANNAKQLYTVPISYSTDTEDNWEKTDPTAFLKDDGTPVDLTTDGKNAYMVINNQATGYYRVNYDKKNWDVLAKEIANPQTKIHKYNRVQIVDDALSFARSSQQDYGVSYAMAFDMVRGLKEEKEYVVWKAIFNHLGFLNSKMAAKDDMYNFFTRFVHELIAEKFKELSLVVGDDEPHLQRMARIQIASWACKFELQDCLDQAKELFVVDFPPQAPKIDPLPVSGDIRSTVHCSAVSQMDSAFDTIKTKVATELDNLKQLGYLSALGCTKNGEKLKGLLKDLFMEPTKIPVRSQDLTSAFSYMVGGRKENVGVVIAFIKENLPDLVKSSVVKVNDLLPGFLVTIGARTVSEADRTALNDLADSIKASTDADIKKLSDAAVAAVASATTSKAWLEAKEESMRDWFEATYSSSDDDGGAANIVVSAVTVGLSFLALRLLR